MSEDSKYYDVQKIIGKKKENGKIVYLVKWKNYSESQATWQELSTLQYVKPLIKLYNDEEKNRRKSNSRSNKSSESVTQQNSPSRMPQKVKKADRGSLNVNSLRSLDEENQEKMYQNRSLKQNNLHLSNSFNNREEKVQDAVPKQGQSFKIMNRNMPKQFIKPKLDLDNTKDVEEEIKGTRKILKPTKITIQGSRKFIGEKRDDQNKEPPKLARSNVQSSSLVDSLISKNAEKARMLQKQHSINNISCQKNLNDSLILSRQVTVNKILYQVHQSLQANQNERYIKPIISQQGHSTIKRINLLHSQTKSSNREYLIQQADSSIKILSGKELLKHHPQQLLEYLESLISQKGI